MKWFEVLFWIALAVAFVWGVMFLARTMGEMMTMSHQPYWSGR